MLQEPSNDDRPPGCTMHLLGCLVMSVIARESSCQSARACVRAALSRKLDYYRATAWRFPGRAAEEVNAPAVAGRGARELRDLVPADGDAAPLRGRLGPEKGPTCRGREPVDVE